MTKKFLSILLILICLSCSTSKQILLEGFIIADNQYPIIISTVDTISLTQGYKKNTKFDFLSMNNSNVAITDNDGYFKLKVDINDSIHVKSFNHLTKSYSVKDYLRFDNQNIILKPCYWEFDCEEEKELYVFIAEKINLEEKIPQDYCRSIMDNHFIANYKVLKNLYGDIKKDSVTFHVFDHYGWPRFNKHERIVLYVNKYCDVYVHEKYQYQILLKTKSGEMASPFLNDDYRYLEPDFPIKPKRIEFENPVIFEHEKLSSIVGIEKSYPKPYFKLEGNKVIALYGYDIDELFELKKLTVLKSRGIFD